MSPPALSSHSPTRLLSDPTPDIIANARSKVQYPGTPKLGAGTLTTALKVFPCTKYNSCSKIEVTFFFKLDKMGSRKVEIGYAIAHIIDKAIDSETVGEKKETKGKAKKLWLEELVQSKSDEELSTILRTLFGPAGGVRKDFKSWTQGLRKDRIVYIDHLKIYTQCRGCGLGSLGLQAFHALLNKLSNGHAFQGTVILSPATPEDVLQDFKRMSFYKQEDRLITFYKSVGYELWIRGKKNVEGSVTVMGGTV